MKISVNARDILPTLLPRNGLGAEIGVFKGNYSEVLYQKSKPEKMFLVDPWVNSADETHADSIYALGKADMDEIYDKVAKRFAKQVRQDRMVLCRMTSTEFFSQVEDESFDWVYVDGDHNYDAVRADIFSAYQKVKAGGFIAIDDYEDGRWWGRGVIDATHDLLASHDVIIVLAFDNQILLQKS